MDISNTKLPDPPPPQSQVYVLMQKIISPLSEITSFVRSGKRKTTSSSSRKVPHHYAETQKKSISLYERNDFTDPTHEKQKGSTKSKSRSSKSKSSTTLISNESDSYENIKYDNASLRTSTYDMTSTSSPKILLTPTNEQPPPISSVLHNSMSKLLEDSASGKSKRSKSIRSKLRQSFASSDNNLNIGKSLSGGRSTFYVPDSVDVDSGIFAESNDRLPQSQDDLNVSSPGDRLPQQDYSVSSSPMIVEPKWPKLKTSESPEMNRRRISSIGGRPRTPPPPPPVTNTLLPPLLPQLDKQRHHSSTWYGECGPYKKETTTEQQNLSRDKAGRKDKNSTTSWYAEIYQSSGDSIGSSSGSSGVSTGGEGGPGDDNVHSIFINEPLYQIYNAAKLESLSSDVMNDYDGYEEVGRALLNLNGAHKEVTSKKNARPSALQLIEPKHGPSRTLWCDIAEVKNSGVLESLTTKERKVQEAKFEILTSEASYLKSLNLLRTHFINHANFRNPDILSPTNRKCLFSNIISVLQCSERLLSDLESCWQDNIMLVGLNDCVYNHVQTKFKDYVQFCEHQGKMDRLLKKLKDQRGAFAQTLEMLEADSVCCGLSLHSFLMLPMQRITRFPLLIMAVLDKMNNLEDEYDSWNKTLVLLNKVRCSVYCKILNVSSNYNCIFQF